MTSLADIFTKSHRNLEVLLKRAVAGLDDRVLSMDAFVLFRTSIEGHMAAEETVLFPYYESLPDRSMGLTEILRKGHKELRVFFMELADAITTQDVDEARVIMHVVTQMLEHHDNKEESELYPALNGQRLPVALDDLARQIA